MPPTNSNNGDPREPGFIALYRRIRQNGLWPKGRSFTPFEAWVDMLLEAKWAPGDVTVNGSPVHLNRGDIYHATRFFSRRWRWSIPRVHRFLCKLEDHGMIRRRPTAQGTHLSIVRYDTYNPARNGPDDYGMPPVTLPPEKRNAEGQKAERSAVRLTARPQEGYDAGRNADRNARPRKAERSSPENVTEQEQRTYNKGEQDVGTYGGDDVDADLSRKIDEACFACYGTMPTDVGEWLGLFPPPWVLAAILRTGQRVKDKRHAAYTLAILRSWHKAGAMDAETAASGGWTDKVDEWIESAFKTQGEGDGANGS